MPKILAIDDKQDNLITLSAILKNHFPECHVLTAQSGPEGLEKAKIHSPDTILLDIKMPGMDGYEVCGKLKEDQATSAIPVILISAVLTGPKDLVKGLDAGADAYLAKPVDEHILIAQVKTALRMKEAEDLLRRQKDSLEEMVSERTSDLVNANVQLKREIEERRKAVETLKESEERYKTLFREMINGFALHEIICNGQGQPVDYRFLAINPAFEKMTGLKATDIVGRTVLEVLPATEAYWIDTYGCVALTGEPTFFENFSKELNKSFQITAFRPVPGQFACIFADITEEVKLREQLNQAQKMESIGRLAGGIAHDFNNKLGVILGCVQMVLMDMEPENPVYEDLEEIQDAAKGAADLTRQLLAFARKQTIAPRELDANETITGMLKMLRRLIGEDIDLAWQPDTNLWSVKMDPAQVDQILANLAVNARDSIVGVGKVTIETKNRVLDDAYCAEHDSAVPGEFVMLTVTDNGCGMEKTILDQVFEPFFTTKGIGKGTGLGLSTVYGIVKQNNGFISVYSEPNEGTTFKIYMPRYQGDASLKTLVRFEEPPRGDGETILLVEDDAGILRMARMMLGKLGYAVLTANSPNEAMEIAGEHSGRIHLLMTDVVMPQMNGKDLAEQVMKIRPEIGTLFMSGYTANAIAHHGILDEGVNFIEKPFMSDSLARKVREVLDGVRS